MGIVKPPLKLVLDPAEVASAFTVPLDFLLDTENQRQQIISFAGEDRKIDVIEYQNHHIWGMTARIVVDLAEQSPSPVKGENDYKGLS